MFSDKSRYKSATTYQVTDLRGRTVNVVATPDKPTAGLLGYHRLIQGQRMDHLAYKYLKDANASWKIAEMNEVMLAETLSEQAQISIPNK